MGVYGDLIMIYPKPYSIYLRGTIVLSWLKMTSCAFRESGNWAARGILGGSGGPSK